MADFLSRRALRESVWVLNREVFDLITMRWGYPDVDHLALKKNLKAPLFSLPSALLPVVLGSFQGENNSLILVAPYWSKRPWFSVLR